MELEKQYNPQEVEQRIYRFWEKGEYFTPKIDKKKKPFCIILPPPNANDPLHAGHAVFVVEDILCRWHKMLGDITLFLPGTDHAGIETQYVFEKKLKEKGKSRFDFDRKTLYQMINKYVEENRNVAKKQLKRLGFSLDWSREKYTLEPEILKTVFATFVKLHQDDLVYRGERIVNFCTRCGTAFSNLEVVYKERKDPLYYMKYGPFVIATVRPETKFGDTAVAVNPKDKRYKKWIGKEFIYQSLIGPRKMKVVGDSSIDPEFGTGAVKVTPANDPNDFEIAKRHNLKILSVINPDGKLNKNTGRFAGLWVKEARKKVVEELKEKGDIVKIDEDYTHRVGTCYRCKNQIEPLTMPQWFIKTKSLAKPAIEVVKKDKLKVIPKRFKKLYLQWMENIRDWNISRQIVWGPRIPVWYCLKCNPKIIINFINKKGKKTSGTYKELIAKYRFSEIKEGLQSIIAPQDATYSLKPGACEKCKSKDVIQETDTFDTWFSSGQWPLTTLGYPDSKDFKYFYPTAVLDTMWDILFFWVARMVMFGLYLTGKIPFQIAHMHSRVVDKNGKKMSKSRGNVINPVEMIDKYSADALRMALVFGCAPASDISLSEKKIEAMRNFSNKLWNASRFILMENNPKEKTRKKPLHQDDKWIIKEMEKTVKKVNLLLGKYHFGLASQEIYQFFWHTFCDKYIEMSKKRREEAQPTLVQILKTSIILLHPFMPHITEEIYQKLPIKNKRSSIMIEAWPKS